MRLKDNSIDPHGISNELLLGLQVAQQVYSQHGKELVVTSLCDGKHSHTSLHYSGNAADLRTRHLTDAEAVRNDIKRRLNRHYDVVLEPTHIHLEYQPRRRDRAV